MHFLIGLFKAQGFVEISYLIAKFATMCTAIIEGGEIHLSLEEEVVDMSLQLNYRLTLTIKLLKKIYFII